MTTTRAVCSLEREALRCERLHQGIYDPALAEQLLRLARDYRSEAGRLLAARPHAAGEETDGARPSAGAAAR